MDSQTKTDVKKNDKKICATVLIVDTDSNQMESLCRGMFLCGHEYIKLGSISEAIDFLSRSDSKCVDLLLTDITEPGGEGFRLIGHTCALYPDLPVIALAGLNATLESEICEEAGVFVIKRPFDSAELDGAIRELVA